MLTSFADDDALFDAVMAGASGYVLKQVRGTDLVGAVKALADGKSLLDPDSTMRMMARLRQRTDDKPDPTRSLTDQELAKLDMSRRTQAAALAATMKANRIPSYNRKSDD